VVDFVSKGAEILKSTSIVVADDHPSQRKFLLDVFEEESALTLVDAVGTASEAIDSVVRHSPDILVLDIDMPGLDVFHAAEEVCRLRPAVKIIFLSGNYKDHDIASALRVNAKGYLSKRDDALLILDAIAQVMKNKRYFSPTIEERLVEMGPGQVSPRSETLSTREWETLEYVAKGYSKKEIAAFLHISVKTVEKHSQSVMNKLDVHDRVLLALWYLSHLKSIE
jgi:DNA-binding NarL/FixJ family response regulator